MTFISKCNFLCSVHRLEIPVAWNIAHCCTSCSGLKRSVQGLAALRKIPETVDSSFPFRNASCNFSTSFQTPCSESTFFQLLSQRFIASANENILHIHDFYVSISYMYIKSRLVRHVTSESESSSNRCC